MKRPSVFIRHIEKHTNTSIPNHSLNPNNQAFCRLANELSVRISRIDTILILFHMYVCVSAKSSRQRERALRIKTVLMNVVAWNQNDSQKCILIFIVMNSCYHDLDLWFMTLDTTNCGFMCRKTVNGQDATGQKEISSTSIFSSSVASVCDFFERPFHLPLFSAAFR